MTLPFLCFRRLPLQAAWLTLVFSCCSVLAADSSRFCSTPCPQITIDFRKGIPQDWRSSAIGPQQMPRQSRVFAKGPVPFRVYGDTFTWVPDQGVGQIRIGCRVKRIFV